MVRSNFRHTAPRKDRAGLKLPLGGQAAHQGRGPPHGGDAQAVRIRNSAYGR